MGRSEALLAAGTREPGGWAQHLAKPLLGRVAVGEGRSTGTGCRASQLHESLLRIDVYGKLMFRLQAAVLIIINYIIGIVIIDVHAPRLFQYPSGCSLRRAGHPRRGGAAVTAGPSRRGAVVTHPRPIQQEKRHCSDPITYMDGILAYSGSEYYCYPI